MMLLGKKFLTSSTKYGISTGTAELRYPVGVNGFPKTYTFPEGTISSYALKRVTLLIMNSGKIRTVLDGKYRACDISANNNGSTIIINKKGTPIYTIFMEKISPNVIMVKTEDEISRIKLTDI